MTGGQEFVEVDVLIIAGCGDVHAATVLQSLRCIGLKAEVLDSSDLPFSATASLALDCEASTLTINPHNGDHKAPLKVLRTIWWRRPQRPRVASSVTDPRVRRFCEIETDTFFRGAVSVAEGIEIINDPMAEWAAEHKARQLAAARMVGLHIPRTLMTNDPAAVAALYDATDGRCVYKTFRSPSWRMAETRLLRREDLQYLDALRHAPMIVQELVPKGRDIRVTVVGRQVIAAEVETHLSQADLDWRLDMSALWRPHNLDAETGRRLEALLYDLGLHYGCIDLRQTPTGDYAFLEVNPSGQFLFVEIDTAQRIVDAFTDLLLDPAANCPRPLGRGSQ